MKQQSTLYSLDHQAQKEIELAINTLVNVCLKHHVPMFASVAIANNESRTAQMVEHLSPVAVGVTLTDDPFVDYIRVFKHVSPTFEADDSPSLDNAFDEDVDSVPATI